MPAKTYRLKIGEFEVEGDKAFVSEMLKRYGPQATAPAPEPTSTRRGERGIARGASATRQGAAGKSLSIREFVQQLNFKKHTDISLAFGYYLEKHQSVSEFGAADINNCYYEAKLEPSNTSQMIVQNIKRGYLMAAKRKAGDEKGKKGKGYTLTRSGEQFIESMMPI